MTKSTSKKPSEPKPERPKNKKGLNGFALLAPDEEDAKLFLECAQEYSGKDKKGKHPGGRPTIYSEEMANYVCTIVSTHPMGLDKLRQMYPEFPSKSVIWLWRLHHPEFMEQYHKAKLLQAEIFTEECVNIADFTGNDTKYNGNGDLTVNNEAVNRSRLRIDTRKWLASTLLPKQYGNLQKVETLESQNDALKQELRLLRDELDKKSQKDY